MCKAASTNCNVSMHIGQRAGTLTYDNLLLQYSPSPRCLQIVTGALETKNVVATCFGNELMKTMLPHLLEQLELCQKSLSAYLETKRAEFPRFYFVSDPTLLEILSLGSDPPSVVPHFQSGLFDSLTNVSFDKVDKTKMLDMFSQQGEKVEFERPVEAKGMLVITVDLYLTW